MRSASQAARAALRVALATTHGWRARRSVAKGIQCDIPAIVLAAGQVWTPRRHHLAHMARRIHAVESCVNYTRAGVGHYITVAGFLGWIANVGATVSEKSE